jgi:hypothetical protein
VIAIAHKVGKLIRMAKTNSNPGLGAKILGAVVKLYFLGTAE